MNMSLKISLVSRCFFVRLIRRALKNGSSKELRVLIKSYFRHLKNEDRQRIVTCATVAGDNTLQRREKILP